MQNVVMSYRHSPLSISQDSPCFTVARSPLLFFKSDMVTFRGIEGYVGLLPQSTYALYQSISASVFNFTGSDVIVWIMKNLEVDDQSEYRSHINFLQILGIFNNY